MKKPSIAPRIILFCISLCFLSFCLNAADFWQAKPASEWNDKQLQKMITNSPWAQAFGLPMSAPEASAGSAGKGGGGGGRGRGGGGGDDQGSGFVDIVARWQSAMPLKQALMRLRFGAEAGTSPQAKAFLDQVETNYVMVLSGPLRSYMRGNPEDLKATLLKATSLTAKAKDALKPTEIQVTASQKGGEVIFFFPRSAPFTLDDKEVEFSTKLGERSLVYKFRLKDMVFGGKLEL
jgi:hypothetical protein